MASKSTFRTFAMPVGMVVGALFCRPITTIDAAAAGLLTPSFICAMLFVNFMTNGEGVQYQHSYNQFIISGVLGVAMLLYCFTQTHSFFWR